jgi:hypothetical protein
MPFGLITQSFRVLPILFVLIIALLVMKLDLVLLNS